MKIIGINSVNFTNDRKEVINGYQIFVSEPLENGAGVRAFKYWLSVDRMDKIYYQYLKDGNEVYAIAGSNGKVHGFIAR